MTRCVGSPPGRGRVLAAGAPRLAPGPAPLPALNPAPWPSFRFAGGAAASRCRGDGQALLSARPRTRGLRGKVPLTFKVSRCSCHRPLSDPSNHPQDTPAWACCAQHSSCVAMCRAAVYLALKAWSPCRPAGSLQGRLPCTTPAPGDSQCRLPCTTSMPQVCGVFIQLDTRDAEARRRDHVEGKQYQGEPPCMRHLGYPWHGPGAISSRAGCVAPKPGGTLEWEGAGPATLSPTCPCTWLAGWLAIREKYKELQAKHGGGGYPPVAPPAAHR